MVELQNHSDTNANPNTDAIREINKALIVVYGAMPILYPTIGVLYLLYLDGGSLYLWGIVLLEAIGIPVALTMQYFCMKPLKKYGFKWYMLPIERALGVKRELKAQDEGIGKD